MLTIKIEYAAFAGLVDDIYNICREINTIDNEQGKWICRKLRTSIWKMIASPIKFETSLMAAIFEDMDLAVSIKSFGIEIANHFEKAQEEFMDLLSEENPLRRQISVIINSIEEKNLDYRILCHREDKADYISFVEESRKKNIENRFIFSNAEYRDTKPFDILIKTGPLRVEGWCHTPMSVLWAPRQKEIIQITWKGINDENRIKDYPFKSHFSESERLGEKFQIKDWPFWKHEETIINVGKNYDYDINLAMELITSQEIGIEEPRNALLVLLANGKGILAGPRSNFMTLKITGEQELQYSSETSAMDLEKGMFIIFPQVHDKGLEEIIQKYGHIGEIWKTSLKRAMEDDKEKIIQELKNKGLILKTIESRLIDWTRSDSNVIKAPKERSHFMFLIEVLKPFLEIPSKDIENFTRRAWIEIRKSRGEAILEGKKGKDIECEEILEYLRSMEENKMKDEVVSGYCSIDIPEYIGLAGEVKILRIEEIEKGYKVPSNELLRLDNIDELIKWRA